MKDTKGKMIFVSALALLMLSAAVPAMADPTKGQKVPVVKTAASYSGSAMCPVNGVTYPYSGTWWRTDGDIQQRRDYGLLMEVTLIIDETTTLEGLSFDNYDRMWQFDRETRTTLGSSFVYRYDSIWDFATAGGGFMGNMEVEAKDYGLSTFNAKAHCLFHGYGAFEGQTLELSYEGQNPQTDEWTGYLLKP